MMSGGKEITFTLQSSRSNLQNVHHRLYSLWRNDEGPVPAGDPSYKWAEDQFEMILKEDVFPIVIGDSSRLRGCENLFSSLVHFMGQVNWAKLPSDAAKIKVKCSSDDN